MTVLSSVLFSEIYNATLASNPEDIWFVMAGLTGLVAVGFAVVVWFTVKHEDEYGALGVQTHEEEDNETTPLINSN